MAESGFSIRTGGVGLWTHDCDNCRALGAIFHHRPDGAIDRTYDVYHCVREGQEGSLVMRFSSEGGNYDSFPVDIARAVAQDGASKKWESALQLLQLSRQREC